MHPRHDEDFYAWAMEEANLLRQRRLNELDIDNLIEELESMGASEKRELVNRLSQLLMHLLKWEYQPRFRGRSWKDSIEDQRQEIKENLEDSPSLRYKIDELMPRIYNNARRKFRHETGLQEKILPPSVPYTFNQIMDETFFPE